MRIANVIGTLICTQSLAIIPPSRRAEISLFFLPKSIETVWRLLEKRGYVKSFEMGLVLLFAICNGILMYALHGEKGNLKPSYERVLKLLMGDN